MLLLGAFRLFLPPDPPSELLLTGSLLVLYLGWTLLSLAHTAWAAELSDDYDRRSHIMGALQLFGLAGAVVVILIPALMDYFRPEGGMRLRAEAMGWLIIVAVPVLFAVALKSARETAIRAQPKLDWRRALGAMVENRGLRRILLADLLMGIQGASMDRCTSSSSCRYSCCRGRRACTWWCCF